MYPPQNSPKLTYSSQIDCNGCACAIYSLDIWSLDHMLAQDLAKPTSVQPVGATNGLAEPTPVQQPKDHISHNINADAPPLAYNWLPKTDLKGRIHTHFPANWIAQHVRMCSQFAFEDIAMLDLLIFSSSACHAWLNCDIVGVFEKPKSCRDLAEILPKFVEIMPSHSTPTFDR